MPHVPTEWTAEMVRALPDDGRRYELVAGELLVTPSPGWIHQRTVLALIRHLDPYLRKYGAGDLLISPADLSFEEDEVLQPDLFVVPFPTGSPTRSWADIRRLILAVEVLSPGTARYDRLVKRRHYQRAGVPEYWIVDPDARLVERWRPEDTRPEVLSETMTWQPDPTHQALELQLPSLFREAWGED
jgi:Uma2 family endonuclease